MMALNWGGRRQRICASRVAPSVTTRSPAARPAVTTDRVASSTCTWRALKRSADACTQTTFSLAAPGQVDFAEAEGLGQQALGVHGQALALQCPGQRALRLLQLGRSRPSLGQQLILQAAVASPSAPQRPAAHACGAGRPRRRRSLRAACSAALAWLRSVRARSPACRRRATSAASAAASRPWEEQRLASKARGGRSGPSTAKTSTAAGTAAKTVVAISGSGMWGNGFRIAPAEQQQAQTLHLCESAAGAARDGETWLALEAAPPASPAGLAIAW